MHDTAVTAPARETSDHRPAGFSLPTRRELAAQIRQEHADMGTPISSSKATRLATKLIEHSRAWEAAASAEASCLTYSDRTGEAAVWNVLAGGERRG